MAQSVSFSLHKGSVASIFTLKVTFLSASRKAFWEAQLTKKKAQLDAANATYDELIGRNLRDYRLDTEEGSQRGRIQSLDEMKRQIELLESEIDALERKLAGGGGIIHLNLRRRF
jgi:uncharacterized small protein (DUF1192 family)